MIDTIAAIVPKAPLCDLPTKRCLAPCPAGLCDCGAVKAGPQCLTCGRADCPSCYMVQ